MMRRLGRRADRRPPARACSSCEQRRPAPGRRSRRRRRGRTRGGCAWAGQCGQDRAVSGDIEEPVEVEQGQGEFLERLVAEELQREGFARAASGAGPAPAGRRGRRSGAGSPPASRSSRPAKAAARSFDEPAVEQLQRLGRVGARLAPRAAGHAGPGRRTSRGTAAAGCAWRSGRSSAGRARPGRGRPATATACTGAGPGRGSTGTMTLGPPALGFSRPETASMASRISSAVEPAAGELPEQAVLRVAPSRPRRPSERSARLAVGVAQHDQPVDRLEPPAALDERRRQPVEQLGMAGAVALGAEVVDRLDQPRAEVVLPEPVDDHPGRQRMRRARPASAASRVRGSATSAGSSGRSSGTRTLGGRGPTGSPLFSQTPRFRTWIGVRCAEVVPGGRDRGRRRRASDPPVPRVSVASRCLLGSAGLASACAWSFLHLVLDRLASRLPGRCARPRGRGRCRAPRSPRGRPGAGSNPSARSARACGCGSGRSRRSARGTRCR